MNIKNKEEEEEEDEDKEIERKHQEEQDSGPLQNHKAQVSFCTCTQLLQQRISIPRLPWLPATSPRTPQIPPPQRSASVMATAHISETTFDSK